MCSIMGYCGVCDDLEAFQKGFAKTISRGPDDSRIVDTGNGLLGFHRLAIMGLTASGMQPFSLGGSYVVCNGEIFGFERLRESLSDRYTFQSDSDCEVLLPLYETYGTEMFRMLDAEFACIIYDGEAREFIAEKHRNILRQEIRSVSARSIMDMIKREPSYLQVKQKI